ncbi:hypothetical protein AB0J74_27170 [Asanoa sp. NPDC049573]|uniref:hypothetical protein n=1 Tax=Asanoa sp. NPDC049573 TaxID=3155396 RepID=UPI0034458E63
MRIGFFARDPAARDRLLLLAYPGTDGSPTFSLAFEDPVAFPGIPEVAGLERTTKDLAPSAALPAEPTVDMRNRDGDSRVLARMSVTDCGESG